MVKEPFTRDGYGKEITFQLPASNYERATNYKPK